MSDTIIRLVNKRHGDNQMKTLIILSIIISGCSTIPESNVGMNCAHKSVRNYAPVKIDDDFVCTKHTVLVAKQ